MFQKLIQKQKSFTTLKINDNLIIFRREVLMLKVLHVFGNLNHGGAQIRTIELMPFMADKGVQFDYCALSGNPNEAQLVEKIQAHGGKSFFCPLRPGIFSFGHRFIDFLNKSNYDIVHSHVHDFSGYIMKLAYKAAVSKRIVHFRTMGTGKKMSFRRRCYHATVRRMVNKYATDILAVCRGAMEFGWSRDWTSDSRCQVIYNGLDSGKFNQLKKDKATVRSELNFGKNDKLVIYVARLVWEKAHNILFDAVVDVLKKNNDVHFIIVGNGILEDKIKSLAVELAIDDHVHFLGVRDDVPDLLNASDCFVLPSLREGLPGVVLEAIAAGLPVVATDLPGVREIAECTNLVTVIPLKDSKSLSYEIIKNIDCVTDEAKTNSSFPFRFDIHACADKLFKIYSQS